MLDGPLLTILLPVRNGAADLPEFLESASRYADAIVALDDGSTDDTHEILASHPLVRLVLENPRRSSFAGWDDAANRNALLTAAAALDPRWILSLDADERIDERDGQALRAFLETDALPGLAYSFRVFAMQGGGGRFAPNPIWVHRLFAFEPEQRFPTKRLHFAPIPTSIPSAAFIRTTFRIQHLGGMSVERRRARYEKYRQADPDSRYWPDYTSLLREDRDEELAVWQPRSPGTPAFFTDEQDVPATEVASVSVIVPPGHPALASADDGVEWIVSKAESPQLDRSLLAGANGTVIVALDGGLIPAAGAIAELAADHAAGYALVAPVVEAPTDVGWDAQLLRRRFAPTLAHPPGALLDVPAVWCSYQRSLLLGVLAENPPRSVAALHERLHRNGYLCLQSEARLTAVPRTGAGRPASLAQAFADGRRAESAVLDAHRLAGRRLRPGTRRSPTDAAIRSAADVKMTGALEAATRVGRLVELARPRRGKVSVLFGRPQLSALWIVTAAGRRELLIVSWSLAKGTVRVLRIPESLEVERPDGRLATIGEGIPRTGKIRRFALHELVSRPFSIAVDDYVRVDLGDRDLPAAAAFRSTIVPALRQLRRIDTSLDRASLAVFLMSAMRATVDEIAPWHGGTTARLDADTAEIAERFFSGHTELDLGNPRERLRLVPWA